MNKAIYIFSCLVIGFLLQDIFSFHPYFLIVILTLIFSLFWHMHEQQMLYQAKKDYRKLEIKMQSTSKDAHVTLKQLMTVVSSIPFPMLLLDQSGEIVMSNDVESLQKKKMEQNTYMKNGYHEEIQEFIKDAFILEKSFTKMMHIGDFDFRAISVPIVTQGKFCGCLLLFQDISDVLEKERIQKQFIADASHELKTPIQAIKGIVEVLNRDDFCDAELEKEFLTQIAFEIERLDTLVKDLLVLSKMSSTKPMLECSNVDLLQTIHRCMRTLQNDAKTKHLSLLCEEKEPILVYCDERRMHQVLLNLISNAIKYSEEGTITIRAYTQESYMVIEVEDCGCGLSDEQKKYIFERFYRVADDRSRKSGGSGLGLAIVKSIVEAHGGKVEVDSTIGKGSIFRVYLKHTKLQEDSLL